MRPLIACVSGLLIALTSEASEVCELPDGIAGSDIQQVLNLDDWDPLDPSTWTCAQGRAETLPRSFARRPERSRSSHEIDPGCKVLAGYFSAERRHHPENTIGIALAGGGSKSAAYAMGVLEGLQLARVLPRADYISSVSGGGYAAYFLYSRLLDRHERFKKEASDAFSVERGPGRWFIDGVPDVRNSAFAPDVVRTANVEHYRRHFPYQARVRYFTDVLSPWGNWKTSNEDMASAFINGGIIGTSHGITTSPLVQGGGAAALLSIHHLTNSVFNWPVSTSPSLQAYKRGLFRAFGNHPDSDPFEDPPEDAVEEQWGEASKRSFEDLAGLLDDRKLRNACHAADAGLCNPPLWIVNASIVESASSFGWLEVPRRNFGVNAFEVSARGYGAGLYGFLMKLPPKKSMSLLEAVVASAAFFDSEQRALDNRAVRLGAAIFQHAFNFTWGKDWPNYNVCESERKIHLTLPFPFYYAHRFARDERSAWIRLVDGGNVENLGLLTLVRRGVRDIIVADSAVDSRGTFQDLCRVKNELELFGRTREKPGRYELRVPGLEFLGAVCNQHLGNGDRTRFGEEAIEALKRSRPQPPSDVEGYSVHHWNAPVLEGCIVDLESLGGKDTGGCPGPASAGERPRGVISRLFILKPAWELERVAKAVFQEGRAVAPLPLEGDVIEIPPDSKPIEACWYPYHSPSAPTVADSDLIPCEATAFLQANAGILRHSCPVFPQHETVDMTFNSSYTLFGAYKDLARYQASFLELDAAGLVRVRRTGRSQRRAMTPRSEKSLDCACSELLGTAQQRCGGL